MNSVSRVPAGLSIRNWLLAGLPSEEMDRLRPLLTRVTLVSEQILHERGAPIEHVFFMDCGVASLTADTRDNGQVEVGLTGWEGMVGASVLLNPKAMAVHKAFVQIAGAAFRMRSADLRQQAKLCPAFGERCLLYVQFLLIQTAQSAACNARHELAERLARWLLLCHDRVEGDSVPLRQEFLSLMLGVRRAGVSIALGMLQSGGLISQARGRIVVRDRSGLESAACECYRLIRDTGEELLGGPK